MVYQPEEGRSDTYRPFQEFINHNLDLQPITPLQPNDIEPLVHAMFRRLLEETEPEESEYGDDTPGDHLDELQNSVRGALSDAMADQLIPLRPEFAHVSPDAMAWLLRLAITMGFAFHNELLDRTDVGEARPDDDREDARRLRRMLMLTLPHMRRAAEAGNVSAAAVRDQVDDLLDMTRRLQ